MFIFSSLSLIHLKNLILKIVTLLVSVLGSVRGAKTMGLSLWLKRLCSTEQISLLEHCINLVIKCFSFRQKHNTAKQNTHSSTEAVGIYVNGDFL